MRFPAGGGAGAAADQVWAGAAAAADQVWAGGRLPRTWTCVVYGTS